MENFCLRYFKEYIQDYTIEGCIYKKNSVKIYKAQNKKGVKVAIKILKKSSGIPIGLYKKNLVHKNVVQCIKIEEVQNGGEIFQIIILEWVEGPMLRQYYSSGGPLTLNLLTQILEGLDYLHKNDTIHGDIKPENILIFNTSEVITPKIIDYNSNFLEEGDQRLFVTPAYCPPEISSHPSVESDIWALGCLIYEFFTKEILFGNDVNIKSGFEFLKCKKISFNKIKGIPEPFRYIIFKSLQTNPSIRFKSVEEIIDIVKERTSFTHRMKIFLNYFFIFLKNKSLN